MENSESGISKYLNPKISYPLLKTIYLETAIKNPNHVGFLRCRYCQTGLVSHALIAALKLTTLGATVSDVIRRKISRARLVSPVGLGFRGLGFRAPYKPLRLHVPTLYVLGMYLGQKVPRMYPKHPQSLIVLLKEPFIKGFLRGTDIGTWSLREKGALVLRGSTGLPGSSYRSV